MTKQHPSVNVGVDVGKAKLDVYLTCPAIFGPADS
jgi:hypothetical protein